MEEEVLNNRKARKAVITGFAVNVFLAAGKLAAGYMGRSSALIADGVHSLSDLLSDVIVWLGFSMKGKPADENHNYGHGKYETLGTFVIGIFLFLVGYEILKSGLTQVWGFLHGDVISRPESIALVVAIISLAGKEALYHYTLKAGKKAGSSILRANAWHQRSDAMSSLGVLLGIAGAMFLGENWIFLDPAVSVLVSFFIFRMGINILKPSVNELLETSFEDKEQFKIVETLESYSGVKHYHKLRTRRIGGRPAIEFHIMVDSSLGIADAHQIATDIENDLKAEFGQNSIVTIHIEPLENKVPDNR